MADDKRQQDDDEKQALDHAWQWFALHATQRLQSVNFFLVSAAFLSAAFVTAAKDKLHAVAAGVAILGVCVSYFLYRMERRIRRLLHDAEAAIRPLEDRIAERIALDEIRIVTHVDTDRPDEWKYSKVFRFLYGATGIGFALGLIYVVRAAFMTNPEGIGSKMDSNVVVGFGLLAFGYAMWCREPPVGSATVNALLRRWASFGMALIAFLAGLAVLLKVVF